MTRVFDRIMVAVDVGANRKTKRLKRAGAEVRWAWFHGVLPIAACAPMRGSFCIGAAGADAHDVADVADVTVAQARKALQVARDLEMLVRDEHGVEWVHDFEVYNPEPKVDATAAERAKRYRDRQRSRRDANGIVTRDDRDANAPEVEEEENTPRKPPASGGRLPDLPSKPNGNRQRGRAGFEAQVRSYAAAAFPSMPDPHRSQMVRAAIGEGAASHEQVAAFVEQWGAGLAAVGGGQA